MHNKERELYRQINEKWFQLDPITKTLRLTRLAFTPSNKDEGLLSVYNGAVFTAKESYEHFTKNGYKSQQVMKVTVMDCEDLDLPVIDDNGPFDGHSSIDFTSLSKNQMEKKGGDLTRKSKVAFLP